MTTTEINIAIAEACGWKRERIADELCHCTFEAWQRDGVRLITASALPNYCEDLNAMHEAEKILDVNQQRNYCYGWLIELTANHRTAYMATARQRSEAFLRTLGRWKD